MSLSEEITNNQPIFSSCESAIKFKEKERQELEKATKEYLLKNKVDVVPSTVNKLGGMNISGHLIRESTKERRKSEGVSYPAHLPRPPSR